jgi:Tannase and feruloyl esterase
VPGMNHCSKGPATDNFDMLSAIVDWAEQNKAPDRVIARVSADNKEVPTDWSPDRTRPRCPWPKVPRYVGGDKETAESFECK